MTHIIRSFERPRAELVAEISRFGPATLYEAQGRIGAVDSRIKPIYPGMQACGPALTVSCHPVDNMMLIAAIGLAQKGDILVVSAGDRPQQGGFGEVLTAACMAKGVAALVTDAGVRDGTAIRARGFPVFSLGLSVKGTVKETLGTINHPVVIGGVAVTPGDIVSADDDGVVIVRKADISEVTRLSAAREEKEAKLMKAVAEGGDVLELTGIGAILAAKGCTYA
jgi:4-hydroxy-4-methyl-2-oxoglutarate aldolase